MSRPTPSPVLARRVFRPNALQLLNVFKTLVLSFLLLRDRRISWIRRGIFGIIALILGIIVVLPTNPLALALMPIISPLLGLPVDMALDWTIAAVLLSGLLRIFPAEILGEHQARVFRQRS